MPIGAITAATAASVVGTAWNATGNHHDTSDGQTTEPVACSGRGGFGDAVLSYRMIYHDGEGRRSRRARLAQVIDFARRRARTQSDVRFCRSLAVGKAAVSKEESQAACR